MSTRKFIVDVEDFPKLMMEQLPSSVVITAELNAAKNWTVTITGDDFDIGEWYGRNWPNYSIRRIPNIDELRKLSELMPVITPVRRLYAKARA